MKTNLPNFSRARYVDIQANWRKLGPVFRSKEAEEIWRPCMEEYMQWRCKDFGFEYKPEPEYKSPHWWESCDWRCDTGRRGPNPAYWDYVCHSACHWVCDLGLYVAKTAWPEIPWRVVTCYKLHSTVWNSDHQNPLLFDINFSAIGIKPGEALEMAFKGRPLAIGRYLKGYLHQKNEQTTFSKAA